MHEKQVTNCLSRKKFNIEHEDGEFFNTKLPCDEFITMYANNTENLANLHIVGRNDVLACDTWFCKSHCPLQHP